MPLDFNLSAGIVPVTDRLINRYRFVPDPEDETTYKSYLGTPVWSPIEFLRTSGTSLDNSQNVGEADGNSEVILRIDTALITVSQTRNIVKTPIAGRPGTVKEYISDGDFIIDIKGAIISKYPLVYPREEVRLLIELLGLPKQIPVASEFLQLFDIDSIVVEQYDIAEKLGSRNEVPFQIQALSDLAEEIILNPNDSV